MTPARDAVETDAAIAVLQEKFERAAPEALELLLQHATIREYPAQAILCYQGQHEEKFSIVVEGQLDIFMDQETGRTFVAYLRAGRSLGGLEYITRTPRIADAVAAEPVTVLEMSFADLDVVIRTDPEILREISREVVAELIESQDRFIRLSAASSADAEDHEVFISYARADVEFAKQLAAGLRRLGVAVWLDVYSITAGTSWARQVGEALDRCDLMLLVLSPRSMASDNSDDEWNYFLDKKKPVIPALHEATDVPYRLNKLQYIDFTTQPFDSALTQLVVAIRGAETTSRPYAMTTYEIYVATPKNPGFEWQAEGKGSLEDLDLFVHVASGLNEMLALVRAIEDGRLAGRQLDWGAWIGPVSADRLINEIAGFGWPQTTELEALDSERAYYLVAVET